LVKSAKIRPQNFISAAPFELFGHLATQGRREEGGWGEEGGKVGGRIHHMVATCPKISTGTHNS
jgi:hypothetical protein